MANNILIDVNNKSMTFARADTNYLKGCAFCGMSTHRVIASSEDKQKWGMLHVCNTCMATLKKLPVSDDDKPEEKPAEIIKA